ncbi:peptidyl-prolyl cis-trans isomerase cyclophilin type [Beutenbergia cavernae DSM 12333]|uniref:Peptidyl-prolyl cis-trans isomerase n=1 Tax=Beutenbergia cavernae (strain ATCC BAA-8 / DSM 12333 / CCUG 43141 / JCM 11478 / NBRC 16432 / NCIMB 13614 / HKI 0122) TaxID=471853 RepID=C5C5R6_BEUC1|nr:peptidylprolyl isomerase [Beutenbergia cavernae]ACQ80257.1 peptidyl-prolyl cis-trans isomerase cyclophilin type [Beutenbergia cavernae DSM 12333]
MSPSRRERENAKRRYQKWEQRRAAAEKVRRERRIVGGVLAGFLALVLIGGIIWTQTRPDEGDPAATPTATDPSATDAPTDAPTDSPAPLPTTNPQMFEAPPPPADALASTWTWTITTNLGDIVVELDGAAAPQAVASFNMLAGSGFYDGTACHRLLPDTLLQCGDPTATGSGGPGYTFGPVENPPEDGVYPSGTVAMARGAAEDSQGSQFFLVFGEYVNPEPPGYTVFGTVTQGLDILQAIGAAGTLPGTERPAEDVIIEEVKVQQ